MNTDICMGCFESMRGYEVCMHCGWHKDAVPEHAYHLHAGTILQKRYIVGNTIGVGGFGITYKAWDANLNSMVAIKEFYPAGLVNRVPGEKNLVIFSGDKKEQFELSKNRFLDEARTMAKFTGHPNIVHVYDFFEENSTAYIVMEYLDGITVKEYLESSPDGRVDVQTATDIVLNILDALSEMHAKKIIHRDISPDNVQITSSNRIKIFDFGAAKLTREDRDETRSIVVKTGYTPPEQYRAKSKQGAYTDLYSVGALFYKLVTGVTPEESIDRGVKDTLKKPSALGINIETWQEQVIMKALALKPELRFQNATAFKNAVLNKKTVDFPEVELKRRRKIRLAVTGLLVLFTVAFFSVFGWYVSTQGGDPLECENGRILVYLPVSDNPEEAQEQISMYGAIADKFKEVSKSPENEKDISNDFEIELLTEPVSSYYSKLMENLSSPNPASVFSTDYWGSDIGNFAADLSLLYKGTEPDECFVLNDYDAHYPGRFEIPTGMSAQVVYVNKAAAKAAGVEVPSKIDNVKDFLEKAQKLNDVFTVAVGSDNINDVLSSLTEGQLCTADTDEVDGGILSAFESLGSVLKNQGLNYSEFSPGDLLKENKLVYLVDNTDELANVRQSLPGYYSVIPIESEDGTVVTMTNHVGVNKNADKNTQKIAMQFIRFMLTDFSQDVMHIQNSTALPVNKSTLETYFSYNGDIRFLSEYVEKFEILGANRHKSTNINNVLYNDIILGGLEFDKIKDFIKVK